MPEAVTTTACRSDGEPVLALLGVAALCSAILAVSSPPTVLAVSPGPVSPPNRPPAVLVLEGSPEGGRGHRSRRARLEILARALLAPRWVERQETGSAPAGAEIPESALTAFATFSRLETGAGARLPSPAIEALRGADPRAQLGIAVLLETSRRVASGGAIWRALSVRLDDGEFVGSVASPTAEVDGEALGSGVEELPDEFPLEPEVVAVAQAVAKLQERSISALEVAVANLEAYRLGDEPMRAESGARGLTIRREDVHHGPRILAQCLQARGDLEQATEAWRQAVERAPPGERGVAELGLASCLETDFQPLEAREAYTRAAELLSDLDPLGAEAREGVTRLEEASRVETERRAAWSRARRTVGDLVAREQAARAEAVQRIEGARRATEDHSLDPRRWIHHGELLLAERRLTAAARAFGRALELDAQSLRAREGLTRVRLRQGDHDEATLVLLGTTALSRRPSALVLLGDALMARTTSGWRLERWSEYATSLGSLDHRSYLRIEKPTADQNRDKGGAVHFWEEAGRRYSEAARLGPPDPRAQARFLDWLLLDRQAVPAAGGFLGALDEAEIYPDLLRVEACRLELAGRERDAAAVMDRFLARAARSPDDVLRVARRWLADDEAESGGGERRAPASGEAPRVEALLEEALTRHPAHAGLRSQLARCQMARGFPEAALEGFRLALASGEAAWAALVDLWGRAPIGPRSGRPPMVSPLVSRRAVTGGAPRSLVDFIELRADLALTLFALERPGAALAELRPLERFLRHEERRLKGTRTRRAVAMPLPGRDLPWTRPASVREEPVDFGNDRERRLWAGHRLLMAHCDRRLGRLDSAARRYAWAARCLAVRDGAVLPEASWVTALETPSRRMAAEALAGLGLVKLRLGESGEARGLEAWARELDPGGVEVAELGRHIESE